VEVDLHVLGTWHLAIGTWHFGTLVLEGPVAGWGI
jgi:hypothetical protein